ncbi:hypothetical protein A2U01_0064702, partial [Trifolium medium]|nr:hypothetical protein [Trifolium medium]
MLMNLDSTSPLLLLELSLLSCPSSPLGSMFLALKKKTWNENMFAL